jgi:hypothetical protein
MAGERYDAIVIGTSQGGRFLPVELARRAGGWRSSSAARSAASASTRGAPRGTVQTYISRILTKLGAKGRLEIVREALRHGGLAPARASTAAAARVSSHDHYSQPGPTDSVDLCPAPGAQAKPQDGTCTG